MFADIYPLTRLPRRFGAFTYAVPDTMSPSEMIRGTLVVIPWRSGSIRGIVSNTHTRQPKTETRTVLEMLPQRLSDLELGVYERVAEETFQSVSSVLHAAFPAPRKRASLNIPPLSPNSRNSSQTTFTTSPHIPVSELDRLERIAMNPPLRTFVQTGDLIETALLVRFLAKHRPGPILFLVPHEHDLHVATELLSMWGSRPSLCTSALTQPKRHDLSLAWRNGEIPLLLSTRIGSLFLPPQNLSAIIIGRSGVDEHAQYDRNPRYDSRRIAQAWSTLRVCPLLLCDTLPRCVDLAITTPSPSFPPKADPPPAEKRRGIAKPAASRGTTAGASGDSLRSGTNLESLRPAPRSPEGEVGFQISSPIAATDPETQPWEYEIVDTSVSVRYGEDPLLSESLSSHINKTLKDGGRVLLICNQKGLGARMECKDCGFVELCGSCKKPLAVYETHLLCAPCKRATKRPQNCRKCGSGKVKTVRRGTRSLEKLIRARWPNASVAVIEKPDLRPSTLDLQSETKIVIATSYYYENVYRPHADAFGLVALPCADQEIRLESDLSRGARRLQEYQAIATRSLCPFVIQTWIPSLLRRLLDEPRSVLDEECKARRELAQAPFVNAFEFLARGKQGLKELDRALGLARTASETTVTKITPARWKILTNDAKLLNKLRETDDSLVIANKTWL